MSARTSATATATGCVDCVDERDHCHGTLVLHHDGTDECTVAGCVGWWERHDLRVHCDELDRCFCGRDAVPPPARLAA